MKKETKMKNVLNKRLFSDDYSDDDLAQFELCNPDGDVIAELNPDLDVDLLSGRDIVNLDGEWEEDFLCLDGYLSSMMVSFYQ